MKADVVYALRKLSFCDSEKLFRISYALRMNFSSLRNHERKGVYITGRTDNHSGTGVQFG